MRHAIWILWPSFLVAAGAEAVFFTVFDPGELTVFGHSPSLSRTAIYSIGFFLFWGFAAASSGLTLLLQRSSPEVNRPHP
jgi:hypothetical protein